MIRNAKILSFQAFGGASVTSFEDGPLGKAATQRRVLALLALAAAGGPSGITRDRAMGLLWPEADTDRARHALSQTLYHVRSALGHPDLFLPGNDIRLNPDVIVPDTWEFDRFNRSGDDAAAIGLYRGPFLDGFFLPASVEFEEWSSSERHRWATIAASVLERLGANAEERDDWVKAVEWRSQLAAQDVASSRAALKLMEVLVSAGDPGAALRHAEIHRRAVRALFETEPDASVVALEASVRNRVAVSPEIRAVPADSANSAPTVVASAAVVAPVIAAQDFTQARAATHTQPTAGRNVFRAAVLVAAAAVAAFAWYGTSVSADPADAREKIVIAPFRVSGADASLAYLHEGMVDLLAARFSDQALTHAVDPGQSMSAWRRLGGAEANTDHDNALQLANRVGATGVIVGSVVGGRARVYVTAAILSAASGKRELEVRAEGPADSLTVVIDRLAGRLLAARYGETDRMVTRTTSSLPALRAYLTGQAAYRRAEYQVAAQRFEAAVRADSQFAVAAFHLALASDRLNDGEQNDRALAIAWRHRAELTVQDRAHLLAFAGPNYPLPSLASEVLAAWEAAVNLTPVRADMWYEFGERLFRQGSHFGIPDAPQRALRAFVRALEIDPGAQGRARAMVIFAAAHIGDTATVRRYATDAAVRDSVGALSPFVRWTIARVFGDGNELARIRRDFAQLDDENLRLIAMSGLRENAFVADGERAARMLGRRTTSAGQLDALLAQHAFALNARDPFRALDVTEQLEERMPGTGAHLRLRILDALYGNGNSEAARDAAARLDRATAAGARGTEMDRAVFLSNVCVLSQWRLAQGERASIPARIETLRATGWTRVPAIGTNPHVCAVLLETWLAVDRRAPNAHQQLLAADSLLLDGPAAGDAARYAHILLARLHQRVGDNPGALSAIRRRSNLTGWPRYRATARAREAVLRGTVAQ